MRTSASPNERNRNHVVSKGEKGKEYDSERAPDSKQRGDNELQRAFVRCRQQLLSV
jgi:hypothetical protein